MLNSLNPSQREAVTYLGGPHLVIAGAGSGKTRVLTYKIAYLLQYGMTNAVGIAEPLKPWNILALTFTNKAANEMKERIGQLVGEGVARYLQMGTFHSVFSRILRAEAPAIGYNAQFTIYDENDSRSLLKAIIKEMGLDDKIYKPSTVHNRISMAKNNIELPDDYARCGANTENDRNAGIPKVPEIYAAYQQRLRTSNAMDFDDLLLYTYMLFRDHEDIRQKYGDRFRYVLVDEYQDTNAVQQKIVLQIVRDHHNICVVGDDAQSIYGFRGANIDNILNFQQQFVDANGRSVTRLFKLEQNYRSTKNIVSIANSLIRHNQRQIPKDVFSENDEGEKIQLKLAYSDREEAMIVCKDIKRIKRLDSCTYSDFAILYRTNAQSRTFEEQMRKDNIPYRIYGGLSFYQRKEIKDVIAYFRLVVNPNDEEALRRIINYPTRGIGNTTIEKVMHLSTSLGISPWEVICQPDAVGLDVNKGAKTKLAGFVQLIKGFSDAMPMSDAYVLGKRIIEESKIRDDIYSGTDPDDIARQENLQELLASLQDFVEERREESGDQNVYLTDFLQEVSLMSDLDSDDVSDEKVVLMTIHAAKGLEFKTVFVVGLEENIFPSPMCLDSPRHLEEERRLFYVAITRAEKHCILTSAQSRYRYGRMEFDTPSRFLNDLDRRYLQIHKDNQEDYESSYSHRTSSSSFSSRTTSSPFASRTSSPSLSSSRMPYGASTSAVPYGQNRQIAPVRTSINKPAPRPVVASPSRIASNATLPQGGNGEKALTVGCKMKHERFGIGTVLRLEGEGENQKAWVEFVNAGKKQLLLKFARFTVI